MTNPDDPWEAMAIVQGLTWLTVILCAWQMVGP